MNMKKIINTFEKIYFAKNKILIVFHYIAKVGNL